MPRCPRGACPAAAEHERARAHSAPCARPRGAPSQLRGAPASATGPRSAGCGSPRISLRTAQKAYRQDPRARCRVYPYTTRACAAPPPAPPRCPAASHSTRTPPSARARPRGASLSGVRQDPAMVAASQRRSACRPRAARSGARLAVDAPTHATSSKRWRFREGWYRGGACRGCRAESASAARNEKDSCPPRPLGRALAASRQRVSGGRHHYASHLRRRTTPKSSRGSVAARRPSPCAAAAPRVSVRAPLRALCAGIASPDAGPPIRACAQLVRAWAQAPPRRTAKTALRTVPSQLSLAKMRCSAPRTSAAARFGGL